MSGEPTLSRRRFLQATGAASAVSLTGYAETDESTRSQETETGTETNGTQEGGTLELINATMTTMDPIAATDTASGVIIQQVFDALMNYPDGQIEVEPLVASDYEVSDDFLTYTFQLKEGATYHNGDEVTAGDFVYAFERLAASENSQRSYFVLESIGVEHETEDGEYVSGSMAVQAEDDYTLSMTLAEPFHSTLPMLAYTSFACYPEGIVGDVEGYDGEMEQSEFATSSPVGCGPFQVEAWSADTEASVSRFDDYHGEVASVDGVHWQVIENDNAIYNYAMNQNADVFNIPTAQYDPNLVQIEETDDQGRQFGSYGPMRNEETANYLAVSTINAFYVGFNTDNVEKPARQAAAYAINQQLMVDQVFKGRGEPAYHFTPPAIYPGGQEAYDQHAEGNFPYGYNESQIQQAQQVMEDAGYGEDNRYEFTLTTYEDQAWQQIAGILRDQLTSAYIDMQIEQAPFSTLIERGLNGNLEGYTLGWIMDWPAPDNFLQLLNPPLTDTSQPDAIAYTNWSDTEAANQAVSAWEQVQDNPAPTDEAEAARDESYVQMEEANWEDVVFLPVYHRTDERMWYDWVDIPRFGGAGTSRQMLNQVTLGDRS